MKFWLNAKVFKKKKKCFLNLYDDLALWFGLYPDKLVKIPSCQLLHIAISCDFCKRMNAFRNMEVRMQLKRIKGRSKNWNLFCFCFDCMVSIVVYLRERSPNLFISCQCQILHFSTLKSQIYFRYYEGSFSLRKGIYLKEKEIQKYSVRILAVFQWERGLRREERELGSVEMECDREGLLKDCLEKWLNWLRFSFYFISTAESVWTENRNEATNSSRKGRWKSIWRRQEGIFCKYLGGKMFFSQFL